MVHTCVNLWITFHGIPHLPEKPKGIFSKPPMSVTPDRLPSLVKPDAPVRPPTQARYINKACRLLNFETVANEVNHGHDDNKTAHPPAGDAVEALNLAMAMANSLDDEM